MALAQKLRNLNLVGLFLDKKIKRKKYMVFETLLRDGSTKLRFVTCFELVPSRSLNTKTQERVMYTFENHGVGKKYYGWMDS